MQEAKTVVSTERQIPGSSSLGLLNITYIIAEFGGLRDGMDPNVAAFLKFDYRIDGQLVRSDQKKVGDFLGFDAFSRGQAGIYSFAGKVFSDEKGCLVAVTYDVDAQDYTVAMRRNNGPLPDLWVTKRTGNCD
ncbi:hypothetical protein [Paracoccus sp. S1E-3]|uniref:hypothetical protein n=1 Tax=Paracoccus sp. S1E-3 TaxID=2756130 RepID=UPI0015EEC280|nr:hypothetical protein [Paracoccus sp. S1E-3]MBA4491712.1 hypothetical protein [Paracoccus sp. S1E-3]